MPPPLEIDPEDDDYVSEEDSDFAPDAENAAEADDVDELSASDSEEAAPSAPKPSQKRPAEDDIDSGDEAIIQKAKKRQKRKAKDGQDKDEDEGGEGGLVKTRSMRAAEKEERRTALPKGQVTIDVDALWAQMTSEPVIPNTTQKPKETAVDASPVRMTKEAPVATDSSASKQPDTILIKRTYNFAGKVHTEEKLVARDSAEAKLYLASLGDENGDGAAIPESTSPKRVLKKAFRSAFEPITDNGTQRSDLSLGVSVRLRARELANEANTKKLNTVEKSRMDWAGYVDKEGIKDELELAGKSKESYAARQEFLARSEAKREEDARRVRLAGKVS
ncbi:Bucentaur or craniofacial development domain containing protein [Naviculisporaceae sp. PSN 640]